MKKTFETLRDRVTGILRNVCGRVSPDRRALVSIALLVLFAALNLWMTTRAIISIGRGEPPRNPIEIPEMQSPPFIPEESGETVADDNFEQPINTEDYDSTDEQEQTER